MQKRYQTQDIVKLVLKRTANCRFGGLPEKKIKSHLGQLESNPLIYIIYIIINNIYIYII